MSVLVTGATGQDGHYLVDLLLRRGYLVHAQSRSPQSCRDNPALRWHVGDPANTEFLEDLILSTQPDEIYNLAAISGRSIRGRRLARPRTLRLFWYIRFVSCC